MLTLIFLILLILVVWWILKFFLNVGCGCLLGLVLLAILVAIL